MLETTQRPKAEIEIPYSHLEYTATFQKPILEAWVKTTPALIIDAVLVALKPWGFDIDGVEIKTATEKLNEYAIVFRRKAPGLVFTLYLTRVSISAENLDWKEAEPFVAGMTAALGAVQETCRPEIESQRLALAMHLQIKATPRKDITAPLFNQSAFTAVDGAINFAGLILQGEKSTVIVDASLVYANGLFVRINRQHPPDVSLQQLGEILLSDEKRLFGVLGLEGDL